MLLRYALKLLEQSLTYTSDRLTNSSGRGAAERGGQANSRPVQLGILQYHGVNWKRKPLRSIAGLSLVTVPLLMAFFLFCLVVRETREE